MEYLKLFIKISSCILIFGLFIASQAISEVVDKPEIWAPEIPKALAGPYISDPAVMVRLDRPASGGDCSDAGPLNFQCLVFRDRRATMSADDLSNNPFMLSVFETVRDVVRNDLKDQTADHLSPKFLDFPGAKIELVGVVNRMDRQFNRDIVPERGTRLACGEISAIYRFAYQGELNSGPVEDRRYQSRLPVTLNVVFPAQPWSGSPDCRTVAGLWRNYVNAVKAGATPADLSEQIDLLVSSLRPADIDRIELNMQGSRIPASVDKTGFGTLATYIIRVFRWQSGNDGKGYWAVSYLSNQIDRARLLGNPKGDENTCPDRRGKAISRSALAKYLLADAGIADVDLGLVNIPVEFLACRAVSISPGGASRSANQPFWNDRKHPILSDQEITAALARYSKRHPDTLNFVGNSDEFRMRLNEASCSGCHQSRSIAGFHFPGADRPGTASVNAIYLPASAHFFGDQPRRVKIIEALASLMDDKTVARRLVATSYAIRPQNIYRELRPSGRDNIQLLAGWGGACLMVAPPGGRRQWGCDGNLRCEPVFASVNQPGIGMCVGSQAVPMVGEVMQLGTVSSSRFGSDEYHRTPKNTDPEDTTISIDHLPPLATNEYISSHQEYYKGIGDLDRNPGESDETYARRVLEQQTGGFPGGALRLGQCRDLPEEATCGLLASTGFSRCMSDAGGGKRTVESCFRIYTSYSGVRACDPASPCRDDYICMSPLGYTKENAKILFDRRAAARKAEQLSFQASDSRRNYFASTFFGQDMPDDAWLNREDHRGVCIPPYFVFQFKADGHVVPPNP
ncbi:hypothetical protein FJU08_08695 [Martelella alba]|uniref:Uncharacterized protein n=1 Tax=Martelella alba TaxID=2590451 RepID=A0A506UFH1_9HYPH|nr:hypothetical protein [Martelella alba]TPW31804.1 hypothetical protein FJU08_08695 [Martelella alba]